MDRWLVRAIILVAILTVLWTVGLAQEVVTIPQLQQVPLDSLKKLDSLQNGTGGKILQQSPYWKGSDVTGADTVTITGVVVVKPGILTYTLARYNIFIQDTTTGQLWGGINVLTNDTSTSAQSTGITALDTGMVVTMTGRVTEFGSQNNSLTELFHYTVSNPIYTSPPPISIGNIIARPAAREVALSELASGALPKPSTGEKYESMYIIIRNVTVISVDYSSGRFVFQDSLGNVGYMYDGSAWYTLRGHKFSSSRYTPPPVGTRLAYVRGVVLPQTRSGTCGDYNIMPLYPGASQQTGSKYAGDIGISSFSPQISAITRNPTPPKRTDVVTVTWKAKNLNAGGRIDSSFFNWKMGWKNGASWNRTKVTPTSGDSTYTATIPAANVDTLISYFVEAYGGGIYGVSPDSSIPKFYAIRQNGLSIRDVQYSPYTPPGQSGFVGDTVTVSGIVTADSTDIKEVTSNRPRLWIASASGAWNGTAMWGSTAAVGVDTLKRGDEVQITGIVSELNSRTNIQVLTCIVLRRGATVPVATTIGMSGFGSVSYQDANRPVDGTLTFEQWEGVLVKTPIVYVNIINADNPAGTATSNFGEFFVSTTKGVLTTTFGIRVNDNGANTYYVDTSSGYRFNRWLTDHPYGSPLKTKLVPVGASISSLTAIMDYSFGEYKLEPRKDDDFGIVSAVYQEVDVIPSGFELSQNYPNPFNPSTTIRYAVPAAGSVALKVYNMLGQEVMTLVDAHQNAGSYVVVFDASRLASGVYFYQLKTDNFSNVKKMMMLK
jgi:DNA/RNA endonuclease YhcR with UshA esterase domain